MVNRGHSPGAPATSLIWRASSGLITSTSSRSSRSRVDWLRGSTWPVSGTRKGYLVGTHRAITPEETVAHAEHFARALGITRVADVTRLDTIGLPVVVVHRPNARSLSVSQGKGISLAAAKASGLMEAIELHHAEHITLPVRFASLDDLRSNHDLVDVTALPRLSVGQFHGDLRLLWIEGVNLLNDAPLWLPYELVHTDFTLPFPPGSGCFVNSSNGLASGNRPVEALVHAICEVVERDATTLWHMAGAAGQAERRLDPGSIDDPLCAEVLALFEAADVAVGIWETTSDVGVAAFFCTIVDREARSWRQLYPSSGAGCHPNRSIALLRALTEASPKPAHPDLRLPGRPAARRISDLAGRRRGRSTAAGDRGGAVPAPVRGRADLRGRPVRGRSRLAAGSPPSDRVEDGRCSRPDEAGHRHSGVSGGRPGSRAAA